MEKEIALRTKCGKLLSLVYIYKVCVRKVLDIFWMDWDDIVTDPSTKHILIFCIVFVGDENVSPHFEKVEKGVNVMFLWHSYYWKGLFPRKIMMRKKGFYNISPAKMAACESSKAV